MFSPKKSSGMTCTCTCLQFKTPPSFSTQKINYCPIIFDYVIPSPEGNYNSDMHQGQETILAMGQDGRDVKTTGMMYEEEEDEEEEDSHEGESEEEPDGRTQIQRTLLTTVR